jgi:esterase/lipase superfamily enzyme
VDVDAFESELADMGDTHPKFTLFASRDDKALALSGWIWGSDARLGAIDPEVEPHKSRLAVEHVNVFDLTDIESPPTPPITASSFGVRNWFALSAIDWRVDKR